jgi:hypothetical protein
MKSIDSSSSWELTRLLPSENLRTLLPETQLVYASVQSISSLGTVDHIPAGILQSGQDLS